LGLFRGLQRPSISSSSPRAIGISTGTLTLLGANFGLSQADLGSIYIGDIACLSPQWVSESSATCQVPPNHVKLVDTQGPDEISLRVCNAESQCSNAVSVPVAGRGDAPMPVATPVVVDAYRQVGQFDTVTVSWSFVDEASELDLVQGSNASVAVTTSFILQLAADESFETVSGLKSVSRSTVTTSITVSRHSPYYARVAAVTAEGGVGNWSAPFGAIHEACLVVEFLSLHQPLVQDQVCESCPEAFAVCAGLSTWNVTARSNYWRLSWTSDTDPLRFARCVTEGVCIGWTGAPPRADPSRNTSATFHRQAIPNLSLIPTDYEACAEGSTGVLCDACLDG
jgi:hypothetical protein